MFAAGEAVWQPHRGRSRVAEGILWGGFALASLAAACVTPHGITAIIQPLQLMHMPALQATFTEWLSPDFQKSPALEMWMLGIVLIGYASGLRLPWPRLALLLGLIHMTLQHSRHGDVLAIVLPLALAAPLAGTLATLVVDQPSPLLAWTGRLARPVTLPGALISAVILVALALPTVLRPIERTDDAVTPATALAAATRLGLSGPVYNAEGFGGYLDFRGVPTFVDGRVEMYGNDFIATAFAAETGDEAALTGILARYKIGWALLLPRSGAATVLDHLPGWERVYGDEWAVVYRRDTAKSG